VLEHQLVAGTHELARSEFDLMLRLARLAARREGADPNVFDRIAGFGGVIARGFGMDEEAAIRIEQVARLHDIGNIGIGDDVLRNPGPLSPEQRREMERHTVLGHEALRGGSDLLQLAADVALNHHERWDGGGYPRSVAGQDIPVAARVVAVADVLDALLGDRPWREAWPIERALAHVRAGAGTHFDPALVDVVTRHEDALVALHRDFAAAPTPGGQAEA
jgi:HD-GYP domain-containing protein (c-di-GMP phosphodiesterase class II)